MWPFALFWRTWLLLKSRYSEQTAVLSLKFHVHCAQCLPAKVLHSHRSSSLFPTHWMPLSTAQIITEQLAFKGTTKPTQPQPHAMGRDTTHHPSCPGPIQLGLELQGWGMTTSLGRQCQGLAALTVRNFPSLNLPSFSLKPPMGCRPASAQQWEEDTTTTGTLLGLNATRVAPGDWSKSQQQKGHGVLSYN